MRSWSNALPLWYAAEAWRGGGVSPDIGNGPKFKIPRSTLKYPVCCFKTGLNITKLNAILKTLSCKIVRRKLMSLDFFLEHFGISSRNLLILEDIRVTETEQPSSPSTIHPALFSLEDSITHGGQVPSNRTLIEVYTDGSKINDQTGSAFCVIANDAITKTWKAKLSPANTVFQAEMLALKAAIEWANTANEDVNIWSDSESSLQALKYFNVKNKITQEAQMTLLENARIRLGWVKAHIGIKGNEIADTLAKEATTDGIPTSLPFPKSFLKKQLLQLSLSRWQAEWDNGETGR
ncbi:hypothetical protein AVEN_8619-1 [Araneus ventricosus]|uniref:ribonuclease H n=1 Tax=Araneus ventricosus TaxID=182803 RepID=A0A4Y2C513_ARAVE|nr:hypothetical protein AVEN_8619-1 [Araneus ventricosus]